MHQFLKGIGLTWLLGIAGTWAMAQWVVHQQSQTASTAQGLISVKAGREILRQELSSQSFDFSVQSAETAKKKRLFWPSFEMASTPPTFHSPRGFGIEIGAGINVLGSALRNELFPGYEESHPGFGESSVFAENYFRYRFNSKQWLPSLQHSRIGHFALYLPLLGCPAIIKEFGADYLILGSSETYRSLIPALLGPTPKTRVLQCAVGGLLPSELDFLLNEFPPRRIQKIFWGISYWSLRPKELSRVPREDFTYEDPVLWQSRGVSDYFPPITPYALSDFFFNLQDPHWNDWLDREKSYWQNEASFLVAKGSWNTPEFFTEDQALYESRKKKSEGHACVLAPAAKDFLSQTVERLQKLAAEVILFLPPSRAVFRADEPECFHENLRGYLRALTRPGVRWLEAPADWGLEAKHFIYPTWSTRWEYLNSNHPNYAGAKLVTRQIREQIAHP